MELETPITLERGVFTLSLDFELIWGTLDLFGPERFRRACERERAVVIDRLLALLAEFEISATWCVVGHLFLERCEARPGRKHPEIVRPRPARQERDWFRRDPGGSEAEAPLFMARSLIEKIRACPVPQEIGCHSFSHVIFGDAECSRAAAESEIAACARLAAELGIGLRSFAFPRNRVGHLDVLREYGFACYRGPEPHWYEQSQWPAAVKRAAHLWEVLAAATPPVVLPRWAEAGLWNIAGSMIYFPMHGLRWLIPVSWRVRRARKGLEAAAQQRRIFHLWLHPTNLADHTEAMFAGLRAILERARELQAQGELRILPMGALAPVPATMESPLALSLAGMRD
jgi:peptidoglycan/xylan/chitin deacetylase (PgdA/CDA1 family)